MTKRSHPSYESIMLETDIIMKPGWFYFEVPTRYVYFSWVIYMDNMRIDPHILTLSYFLLKKGV